MLNFINIVPYVFATFNLSCIVNVGGNLG